MKIYFALLCATLASCGIYRSSFDCPPGKGVGCKSVHEVLDLIVEKEEGEDLFVEDPGAALLLKNEEKKKRKKQSHPPLPKTGKKLYLLKEHSGDSVLVEAVEKV